MSCAALLLLYAACVRVSAGDIESFGRPVILASKTIHQRDENATTQTLRRAAGRNGSLPLLVHFNGVSTKKKKRLLAAVPGVDGVLHYVPHDSWLVLGRISALEALRKLPEVSMADSLTGADKFSRNLVDLCLSTGPRNQRRYPQRLQYQ
jgi:hypothetical protein